MSLKDSTTTCDYLDFDYTTGVAHRLRKDPKTKLIANYISVAINTGLRSSDILVLTWEQLRKESLPVIEKKTSKKKSVKINEAIHSIIQDDYSGSPFVSRKGKVIGVRQINNLLKKAFASDVKKGLNISSHTLRKTFGRRVYSNNGETESSLVMLMDLFNHASIKTTKIYLGVRQEELNDIYMNL
jgi:integrase